MTADADRDPRPPLRRNRDYVLLWTGAGATLLGARVSGIAYPLLVLWQSGSATAAGLVGFAAMLPSLVVQLHAGALVDRFDRRRLMILCDLGCLLATASVAAAVLTGHVLLPHLMAAAFVQGSLAIFYRLAERAGVRHLVPPGQLPQALGANEARGQAAGLLGVPAGSFLYAAARWSPFSAAALAHAMSLVSLLLIRKNFQDAPSPGPPDAAPPRKLTKEITEGLAWTWRQPFLRTVMILISGSNLLFQGLSLVPMVIIHESGGSAADIGVITAVSGVGGMLGALSGAWWMRRANLRTLVIGCMAGWAVMMPLVAFTQRPVLIGLLFALAAHIGGVSNVAGGVYQVRITPDGLQGRVSSVMGVLGQGANSLGMLAGGAALDTFGASRTVLGISAAMAVIALLSFLLPAVARAPADEDPAAADAADGPGPPGPTDNALERNAT
ncbi:MFS transporter [Streptomyces sp. NPDC050617]|uniref:MFS transporter n=1 Tax=Streptomyces sp. NPDC050617 TaxID=3154628 RepID=UPI00341B9CB8